jgi:hypothetical protein
MTSITTPVSSEKRTSRGSSLLVGSLQQHGKLLYDLAGQYIWWLTAEEAMRYPARVVAQVMNIGVFDDVKRLTDALGEQCLKEIVLGAEAGQFNDRSWHYWNHRLGLAEYDKVPPPPVRIIP